MELTPKAEPFLFKFKDLGGFCVSSFSTLGASVSEDAGENGLKKGYGILKAEALDIHGSLQVAELSIREWALIQNFAPCNPNMVKVHDGRSCPAEWLNKSRYHENWLQNLLTSASMGDFCYPPPKPL